MYTPFLFLFYISFTQPSSSLFCFVLFFFHVRYDGHLVRAQLSKRAWRLGGP